MSNGRYAQRGWAFQSFAFRPWGLAGDAGAEVISETTRHTLYGTATTRHVLTSTQTSRHTLNGAATTRQTLSGATP